MSRNYRTIWKRLNGPIPEGYEIHHIDGNKHNNNIDNLKMVTIQEHFDIHYSQGDYGACHRISQRMNVPKEMRIELARAANIKRFSNPNERLLARQRTLEQFADPIKKERHRQGCKPHSDRIWINNGVKHKRIKPEDFHIYNDWQKGRIIPIEQKLIMKNNRTTIRDKMTGRFVKHSKEI